MSAEVNPPPRHLLLKLQITTVDRIRYLSPFSKTKTFHFYMERFSLWRLGEEVRTFFMDIDNHFKIPELDKDNKQY